MKTIIFATGNKNKIKEIKMILSDPQLDILSQDEAGFHCEVEENGCTFEENALIKARAVARLVHADSKWRDAIVMADDSGLEIDFLNKEPGIYSSRYMGEDTPYLEKNTRILQRMKDVPEENRTARFVCAIAAVLPDNTTEVVRGVMEGRIADHIAGENGFGYDPIFWIPDRGMTSAEVAPEEKNEISHRGDGLRKMKAILEERKTL